jgi:hypothetical protein
VALSESEIDRVIARLKKGDAIYIAHSGGRYIYELTYDVARGLFVYSDFQEGTTFDGTHTDASIRPCIVALDEDRMRRFLDIGSCG